MVVARRYYSTAPRQSATGNPLRIGSSKGSPRSSTADLLFELDEDAGKVQKQLPSALKDVILKKLTA